MTSQPGFFEHLRSRVASLSLFSKIVIGNSLVILAGAIGGTLITHFFTEKGRELLSILLFASVGLFVSILINLWIVRTALKPLVELRRLAEEIQQTRPYEELTASIQPIELSLANPDPDTHQLAHSLSSLIRQLETSNCQLRAISTRAIHAQEEERIRISHSLHDDTGQALLSLLLNLERLEKRISPADQEIRSQLIAIRQLARDTLEELRKIISDLRPSILDDLGLIPAMRWYARTHLEDAGIQLDLQIPEEPLPLSPELTITLFRIVQEAVNNIVRHAGAKKANIMVSYSGNAVNLRVEDDGCGFNINQTQAEAIQHQQWGLIGIQERAELVGGCFSVISTPGKGTQLQISVPFSASQEDPHG